MSGEVAISNVLLSLFAVLASSLILGEIFERLGLDAVIGYIIAGLLLGPSVLGWVSPHAMEEFAIIGAVLILFLAGLKEEDASALYKNKTAMMMGLGLLVFGFVIIFGVLSTPLMSLVAGKSYTFVQIAFLALAYAVVDLGVPAKMLMSKRLLNTEFGQMVFNGAVINVIAGLSLLTLFTLFFTPELGAIASKFIGVIAFMALFMGLFWIVSRFGKYMILLESEEAQFTLTMALVLLMAFLTESLGFSNILGAFLAGIIISRSTFSGTRSFVDRFKAVSMGLFVPLFFAWFGLELVLSGEAGIIANIIPALIFFGLSCVLKFSYTYVYSKIKKIPAPGLVSSSMLSLDVETLIILILAIEIGVFEGTEMLSIFAPSVLLTTILVAVLVKVFMKLEAKDIKV